MRKPKLLKGDMLKLLPKMDADSVSAVITDPPYHLTSIVKRFGAENAAPAKVGKTGAYARASKGFMGKVWDGGDIAFRPETWAEVYRVMKPGAHLVAFGGTRTWHRIAAAIEDAGFEIRDTLCWLYGTGFPKSHDVSKGVDARLGAERARAAPRSVIGHQRNVGNRRPYMDDPNHTTVSDVPASAAAAAAAWQGWGTALKPSFEPIILARKPLIGTVAANVLAYGTGALNIEVCRVEAEKSTGWGGGAAGGNTWDVTNCGLAKPGTARPVQGRWPANTVHDGSDEVEGALGTASRFFYSAKAGKSDRNDSKHPTVKPVALMMWLCKLITPPGGLVLDPFAGSGTTLQAAYESGFDATGAEMEPEYQEDIARRIAALKRK